ncbi:MAG TPA: amino acid permease [Isosphaeraceae bacterium]|jgi:amino acid transporter|nr:amino acid permease [Isosphaeraceae bacterium]
MHSIGERPRELKWYHAGPMLFGDWGTSRLYVLGLAYLYTRHASFWFILAMCVLMVGVGWSYTVVCRLFPDGGGVYSSAKQRSQLLAVVGALLLCADYVVTASLSCLDAFHYLGIRETRFLGLPLDAIGAAATILAIGALNYFGPTKTGLVAMVVAIATVALTLVIAVACLPYLNPHQIRLSPPLAEGPWLSWVHFTEIVLALSGVEAVANMTGIMVPPVDRTARRTIVPVLTEIVVLNLLLAAAMNTLPEAVLEARTPDGRLAHTGDMLRVIAEHYVGPTFAAASAVVFAALLLSAVNTAIGALVSVQYMLGRDKELPQALTGLNRYGMPLLPLYVSAIIPAAVLLVFPNVEQLADLYAVGVVGAIAINLGSISTGNAPGLRPAERALMIALTTVLIGIELTICYVKPHARSFALLVLVVGLAGRLATIVSNKAVPIRREARNGYLALAAVAVVAVFALSLVAESKSVLPALGEVKGGVIFGLSAALAGAVGFASYKTQGYREAMLAAAHAAAPAEVPARPKMIQEGAYKPKSRIMVATQGNPRLIDFALQECQSRQAELQLLFIRHLAFNPIGPIDVTKLDEDEQAQALFDRVRAQAKEAGVPLRLLYGVARDIPDAILDMAVTHGADMLLLGSTRRGALWKAMKGDVIQAVAEQLPESVGLLIHA